MSEVLRVKSIERAFGQTTVLQDVSFSLDAGDRLAVLGPSGSGKTTLLRLIAGLEPPTQGDIIIAGKPASRAGEVLVVPENREVAMVFQGLALFPHLRALEQIAFAARGRGGLKQAASLLDRIGLGHRANARLDELSGGERQRIALARALAQEPKLILMDEPFASLDDEKRAEMRDLLRALLERTETALILVTHSRDDALDLARRALVLERGRPVAHDLLETVLSRPGHAAAVRALGLGQILNGEITAAGEVQTAFGKVRVTAGSNAGPVQILVRPGQPQIATNGDGIEAEVFSLELRPPEAREVRRVAVVRVGENILRVFVSDRAWAVGARVRVRIEGECEMVEGGR